MPQYQVDDIRNIAVCGHGDTGKTTLLDLLLYHTKATNRLGSVKDGSSILDFDPEEKEKQITISSSLVHTAHNGKELNFIDTPGYLDFFAEVVAAMSVVEGAVITVSATAGIQVNTRRTWELAEKLGLATAIVVTRTDNDHADFAGCVASIREMFGKHCIPVLLPIGVESDFSGVVDVLNPDGEVPPELQAQRDAAREQMIDAIVEADDQLMEKYLEEGEVSNDELLAAAGKAVASRSLIPVLCSSAEKQIGHEQLLDLIADFFPSPRAGRARTAKKTGSEEEVPLSPEPEAPLCAQVFKVMSDPFVGKLSFLRVFSGTVHPNTSLYCARTGKKERVGDLLRFQGKEQSPVDAAIPGDLIAVAKVEELRVGDTICAEAEPVICPDIEFPTPMVSLAVAPKSRGDEQKISGSLTRLAEEDPSFSVGRDSQTQEMVMTGMSNLHLDIMIARLKRRFDVEVVTREPKVPYKETITATAEAQYKHKKQTGGRGQYGEVYLRLTPQERGAGFEFADEVVGGVVPNQFIPAVEKGVREALQHGVLAGYPVVDVRVALFDGSHHSVDSSEASFKMAANRCFEDAFMAAKPVLLEPVANIVVMVPTKYMGDVVNDLSGRRGRPTGIDAVGDWQTIKAQVPLAEIMRYSTELRSMTGGEGSFTMELSHYDVVPHKLMDSVVAKAKAKAEEAKNK